MGPSNYYSRHWVISWLNTSLYIIHREGADKTRIVVYQKSNNDVITIVAGTKEECQEQTPEFI